MTKTTAKTDRFETVLPRRRAQWGAVVKAANIEV
jgi:hypothetical protein